MRTPLRLSLVSLCVCLGASGQEYSIDWYAIAGGGGTSAGGGYSLSGTIGQHDAGEPMTGGSYTLSGGFWALVSVVQTQGLPALTITRSGKNVIVSWPDSGNYTLQQTANVAAGAGGWSTSAFTVTTSGGVNSITITPSAGKMFFRLKQ